MILILSGVSGVGKTTIAKLLEENHGFMRSISYTSRAMRDKEEHGKDYMFIAHNEFQERLNSDFFLEHTNQFGNFYGTAYAQIEQLLNDDKKVIMCLSREGFEIARNKWPQLVVGIYLLPPSIDELQERLCERNTSNRDMCTRMDAIRACTQNIDQDHDGYHHKITPGTIEETLGAILAVVDAFKAGK